MFPTCRRRNLKTRSFFSAPRPNACDCPHLKTTKGVNHRRDYPQNVCSLPRFRSKVRLRPRVINGREPTPQLPRCGKMLGTTFPQTKICEANVVHGGEAHKIRAYRLHRPPGSAHRVERPKGAVRRGDWSRGKRDWSSGSLTSGIRPQRSRQPKRRLGHQISNRSGGSSWAPIQARGEGREQEDDCE